MICDDSLKRFALAASFTAFLFNAGEARSDIYSDADEGVESISRNWREFNSIPSNLIIYSSKSEIIDAFDVSYSSNAPDFDFGLDSFFASIEDGTIFNDVGSEVWAMAESIVQQNPKIINYI